jgi:hypothetical protein
MPMLPYLSDVEMKQKRMKLKLKKKPTGRRIKGKERTKC